MSFRYAERRSEIETRGIKHLRMDHCKAHFIAFGLNR